MIASWLLKAKTLPPRQLVAIDARDRLIDRLKVGRTRKVTLLEAPAGFGKTTLLAQWREMLLAERTRVAWLTLDRDDTGDRLVAYIAFALQEAGVDMAATGFLSDDRRGSPTGALALHSLLEAAAQDGHAVYLIFDDLEKMTDLDAQRQLDTLISYAPDNLHIAIAARTNPGLSLARLSLAGLVNRIDATSLRFTPDEMTAFLEKASPALDVRTAMARAEGWPVALQILRAVAMRAEDSGEVMGGERLPEGLAASYFTEQLVHGLAPHQLAFLRDISLLDEVSLALADFARDASDSAHILRELEYLSALIPPLEGADGVVRLHPMLREHFATLAGADPARCALINRQAAQWFASARKLPTALRYAVASGDKMLTGTLIVEAGGVLIWIRRGMSEVVAADKLIDDEMIAAMPRLGLMRTIVLIKQSRLHEARAQYDRVAAATDRFTQDPSAITAESLQRESLIVFSMLVTYCCLPLNGAYLQVLEKGLHGPAADDVELSFYKQHLSLTYQQSGRLDLAWRYAEETTAHCLAFGSIYGTNFVDFHLGVIAMARGDTQDSVQHYEKGCRKSRRHFPHDVGLRLIGDVLTAELDLERNAIANVKRRLARVIDRLHGAEAWFDIYAAAYGTASEIYFLERGTDETLEFLDQAQARAEHLNLTKLRPLLDALRVASLTCAGDIDRALRVAECSTASFSEAGLDNGEGAAWREVESLATAWVRLMLRHGRYSDAIRTAEMALSYARPKGLARMTLRLNVLVAMCNYASGERTMALSRIGGVCREVTRTGYLRAVLREGADLASLLHDAGQTLTDETLRQRARELEKLLEGQDLAASRLPIFSPREIDVLRLLSKGLQDKVIGRRLGVTEHAVRFHLKNIYSKTRAHGRLEAIVRARELGILDQVAS